MGASVVFQAREWAKAIVHSEYRGPGDLEGAMRRCETKYGIPHGTLWGLRYRHDMKDVSGSLLVQLYAAYEAARENGKRAYEHERSIAEATGRSNSILARMAAALSGQSAGQDSKPD